MSIKRNTLYNLSGYLLPTFISLVTVPLFLHLIGADRYGVLALVWLFLGYFGLFDPGISKAAEYHIARLPESGQAAEREKVFWTAIGVNLIFGLTAGVVVYLVAHPIFATTFKMPANMRHEVMESLPWLAVSAPLALVGGAFSGALQAREQFGVFNLIRIFNVITTQLVPLAVAYFHGPQLNWLIPAVILSRMIGLIPSIVAVMVFLPIRGRAGFDRSLLKGLFSYGGWITVSNVLAPLLQTIDRMIIGSLLGAEDVAFYTVPFNLAARISALPAALENSIFPRLSRETHEDGVKLASSAVLAMTAIVTPIVVLGLAALPTFMRYWLGSSFAQHSSTIGIILLVGFWINGLAYVPFGHLRARGRPDIIAKFHAAEVLPYVAVLWVGMHYFGLIAAAAAWTLRVSVDTILMFAAASTSLVRRKLFTGAFIVIAAACFSPRDIISVRTLLECGILAVSLIWSWQLSPEVRSAVRRRFIRQPEPTTVG